MASDRERAADRNPYVIGVPLTDTDGFYGRMDTFRFIRDVLRARKQNVIVLYGQRRIGKTSVLHRAARWLQDEGAFSAVYYDLQGKERLSLGAVLENLAQTLARQLGLPGVDPKKFDSDGHYFSQTFLPQALAHLNKQRLVLFVDEFDVLSDELESPRTATKTLFPYLQDLITTRLEIGFVFVVGRRIEELATHFQAIFKQAVYRRLGRLTPEESRALIVEPARGMITYESTAVQSIQRLAAGHPYFTQLICFEVFNAARAGRKSVTEEEVDLAATRAIETGHGALNWFWEGLPRAERFILSAIAHASDQSGIASKESIRRLLEKHRIILSGLEFKDAPDRLIEWEMLFRDGTDAYQFVVEIVRRWVLKEHPLSSARRDIDHVNKRAVRLYENAREAHEQGELPYARDEYRRALATNPNHSGAQLGLALVLYELGEIDESIVEFERAYAIDEMSARDGLIRAQLAKAKIAERAGDSEAAAARYRKVLTLAPKHELSKKRLAAILMDRAEIALKTNDLNGANTYRKALELDHSPETLARVETGMLDLAARLELMGKPEVAAEAYALLVELLRDTKRVRPSAVEFASRAGEALIAAGHLEVATRVYGVLLSRFAHEPVLTEGLQKAKRKITERNNIDRIFGAATAAHDARNFSSALDAYKKLVHLDVYVHKGTNVPLLMAHAVDHLPLPALKKPPTPSVPTPPSQSPVAVRSSLAPREVLVRPRFRPLIPRWALVVLIGAVVTGVYLMLPASVTQVSIEQPQPFQAGKSISLTPTARYNSTWRRRPAPVTAANFTWRSDNELVATVSSGKVQGTGPGQATISASVGGVSGSARVTVTPWSIAPLRANITSLRLFQRDRTGIIREERSGNVQRFASTKGPIFAELTLTVDQQSAGRQLKATLAYMILGSGRPLTAEWVVNVKPTAPDVKTEVRLGYPDIMDRRGPQTVTVNYDGQLLASRDFEIY